ncbi:MAG TPA: ornithine carbamoyltransferase [Thermoleophilia bacterium]|nr:ornithine carbamoyltransferase [Thermoleophilia bacterium]
MSVRHFLTVTDLSKSEFATVLDRAEAWKQRPIGDILAGRTVVLIFGKPSTRTRVSFSVGVYQLGGMALYLSEQELQMRKSESIEDTARVLSRYADAIVIRTFAQKDVEDLAAASSVPVINALTDEEHPCQALTDLFTFKERFTDAAGRKLVYLGDGNNVAASLAEAGALAGVDVCLSIPEGCDLPVAKMSSITALAALHKTKVWVDRDPQSAAVGASALYTDVWVSMGQREDSAKLEALQPYQVNAALLRQARPDAIVLHCLPAHRGEEITNDVIDGPQSAVFDQAENRLHVQKALVEHLLGKRTP